jgi:hypothetical protein
MQITGTPNIFSCISTTPDIRVEHIDLNIFYELCITLIMMSEEEVLSLKASRLLSFLEKNGTPCENTGDALTSMTQFVQMHHVICLHLQLRQQYNIQSTI